MTDYVYLLIDSSPDDHEVLSVWSTRAKAEAAKDRARYCRISPKNKALFDREGWLYIKTHELDTDDEDYPIK